MADDNDGRWWYHYCQAIYDRAIRRAILFRDADPNRVYVMGISEGGYAAFRLGAHMADRWAGSCAMAAAEPMDTSPPENFRNLPLRCAIGERDTMFDRIGLARRFFARLDELQEADGATNAYVHFFDEQAGRGTRRGLQGRPGMDRPLRAQPVAARAWSGPCNRCTTSSGGRCIGSRWTECRSRRRCISPPAWRETSSP